METYVFLVFRFETTKGRLSERYGREVKVRRKQVINGKLRYVTVTRNFIQRAPEGYSISGFWGRAGSEIDSIGVHYRTDTKSEFMESSPLARSFNIGKGTAGGIGGYPYRFTLDNACRLYIGHGSRIDSLQIGYCDGEKSERAGGDGGTQSIFGLSRGEYITAIHGHLVKYKSSVRISSISFITNKGRTSSTFGDITDTPFYIQAPSGSRIEFLSGTSGSELDLISGEFE